MPCITTTTAGVTSNAPSAGAVPSNAPMTAESIDCLAASRGHPGRRG